MHSNSNVWPCLWSCCSLCQANPQTLCQSSRLGRFSGFWSFARSLLPGAIIVYRRIFWSQSSLESLHLAVNDSAIARNISRQWLSNCTEPGQWLLMPSHCRNALPGLSEYFLKENFIPLHMLSTHSSHVVLLYSNLFFASTYVLYVAINCMCGTRETLDMLVPFCLCSRFCKQSLLVTHHTRCW